REHATRSRWLVTFSFGLIHGLGFATILKEMALSRGNLVLSLASFNFGVELGQITVVTTAFLGLGALTMLTGETSLRRLVSAGAATIGIVWFIQRAFLA
ncbi:MAG: HupE/UreJ family protein, partial [Bacillati bacterium ANGP1]